MAAISTRGLTKRYGDLTAVDDLSFEVGEGEVYALLGHNGAGKTTTVEILEGYRERSSGDVTVLGQDPGTAGREFRDRIGIVLQTSGVEHELTVAEVVDIYGCSFSKRRDVREVVELVGLGEKLDERIRTLSGGQRRRLDLAMGIVGRPDLLFLDEPTTGFDPAARRNAWELVRELGSGGTTVLLTTHYLDEAEHLADRVGVLVSGRLVAEGTPDELIGGGAGATTVRFELPADVDEADVLAVVPGGSDRAPRPGRVHHRHADRGRQRGHRLGPRAGHRAHRPRGRPAHAGGRLPRARRSRRAGGGGTVSRAGIGLPATPALVLRQVRYQQLSFRRTPIAVFFTLALPLIMLVLFNALFGDEEVATEGGTWPMNQFYTGSLAAFTAVSATFTNLANLIPIRREEGVLKRWRGTPLPPWVYIAGAIGCAVVIAAVGVLIMLTVGVVAYDLDVDAAKMPAAVVTFVVGVGAFAALGVGGRLAGTEPGCRPGGRQRDHPAAGVRLRRLHPDRRPAGLGRLRGRPVPAQSVRAGLPGGIQPECRGAGVRVGEAGVRRGLGRVRARRRAALVQVGAVDPSTDQASPRAGDGGVTCIPS